MRIAPALEPLAPPPASHASTGLAELRAETLRSVAALCIGLALLLDLAVVFLDLLPWKALLIPVVLAATAGLAAQALRVGLRLAVVVFTLGLTLTLAGAAGLFPSAPLACSLSLPVVFAGALLGWPAGLVAAVGASGLIAALAGAPGQPIPAEVADVALLLVWANALATWILSRPLQMALAWYWHSYTQALQTTEEARIRQGELASLSKSLGQALDRLEQMAHELERARHAAEEASRLKAQFAAAVSHELRTPVNLIVGFSEMMANTPRAYGGQVLPSAYRQHLEAVYRNACAVSRLVDDILDLSQIEAHRMALDRTWASLPRIVEDARATVDSLFEHLGLSVSVDISPEIPTLYVDANRIRQILINLLNNAARFTDQGGITIRATCDEREVLISVADTGSGIAPDDLPYVFDAFHAAGPPNHRRRGGGLGLTICKQFVEMHGGYIWAESRLGEGSTFHLALPLCDNVVSAATARPLALKPTLERTIAVLDREPEATRVLQRYLDGYRAVWASTPRELRQLAEEHALHAIVLTSHQPPSVWPELQAADQRLRGLPVLTCQFTTPRTLAEELDVAEYLIKPVSRAGLGKALRRAGRGRRDVLIAEDDPEMLGMLAEMVARASTRYHVRQARDGAEALALAREKRPDIVLLDLMMPRVDGYEVLRELKADPTLGNVPVVVISARGLGEDAVRARTLSLSQAEGLTVGEVTACMQGCLDALLGRPGSPPVQPAGSAG